MDHSNSRRGGARNAALLLVAFAGALLLPAPSGAEENAARADVLREVEQRLPGWRVTKLDESWESAWTVVARCAGEEIGFQLIPEHGLPVGDAWTQPNDEPSREWLARIADHGRYLIWREHPTVERSLSCNEAIAISGREPPRLRDVD